MWNKIKENRDWLLIIIGSVLVIISVFNLTNFNPFTAIKNREQTPAVEQEGFAPLFIPKTTANIAAQEGNQPSNQIYVPDRIVIDKIGLDAPVKPALAINVSVDDQEVTQFLIPEEFAAGWHEGSASLGILGNTVISGHHNAYGEVFANLVDLEAGDEVIMLSSGREFFYTIVNKMILPEKDEPLETRLENARWILPSKDERLTLVTCWPADSNSPPLDPGRSSGKFSGSHTHTNNNAHKSNRSYTAIDPEPEIRFHPHTHTACTGIHRAQCRPLFREHALLTQHGRGDYRLLQSWR